MPFGSPAPQQYLYNQCQGLCLHCGQHLPMTVWAMFPASRLYFRVWALQDIGPLDKDQEHGSVSAEMERLMVSYEGVAGAPNKATVSVRDMFRLI